MSEPAEEAVPAGKLRSVVTHLAMEAPPPHAPPAPPPGIAISRRRAMATADYLRLYHAIGDDWLWWSRLTWDEPALTAHLAEDETEVYVVEGDDGEEIGLIELNLRPEPDIELRYFGVVPSRIGTGLGPWLLRYAIAAVSRHRPRRMILNTCTYDHPGALAFYRRQGFAITHSEVEIVDDPRLVGLIRRDAAPHFPLARQAAR